MPAAGDMVLATSITLPLVRQPVVVAKMLTTLAALAYGTVIGGLGPGSSRSDYGAVGIPFEERWARFDAALRLVRALVRGEPADPGRFYPVEAQLCADARSTPTGVVRQLGLGPAARRHGLRIRCLARLGVQPGCGHRRSARPADTYRQ